MVKVIDLTNITNNFPILGYIEKLDDFVYLVKEYKPKVIFRLNQVESERMYDSWVKVNWFSYFMDLGNGTFVGFSVQEHDVRMEIEGIHYGHD